MKIPGYPRVMSEWETILAALGGRSIARFGDGELRLALGISKHIAQEQDPLLTVELRNMLRGPTRALCCIPNAESDNGKPVMWGPTRYSAPEYVALYGKQEYGSSFICRPDSAPTIDTDAYWEECCKLWNGKDVTLVIGTRGGSITQLKHARHVRLIYGPERDAYREVDTLVEKVGLPDHTVLICLGPCATVLAERLARRNVHALDLGHMGRFMPQRFQQ